MRKPTLVVIVGRSARSLGRRTRTSYPNSAEIARR
jgi:hypothetical protein